MLVVAVVGLSRKSEPLNGAFVPSAGTPPQLNAALCAERSKQSYEAPLRECQTELNKTTMSTSSYRRGVYRGALAAAGSCPALAACGDRDQGWDQVNFCRGSLPRRGDLSLSMGLKS